MKCASSAISSLYVNVNIDKIVISNALTKENEEGEILNQDLETYQNYKLTDRIAFTCIVWMEQIAMFVAIHVLDSRDVDLRIDIFYIVIVPLFVIGQLMEGIYQTYMNPQTKHRQRDLVWGFIYVW